MSVHRGGRGPGHMCRLRGAVTTTGASSFAPSSLFTTEYGYAFDPTNLAKVWQDSAATTAGAVGSPIGRLDDISGNSRHFSQATSTARPTLQADGFDTDGAATYLSRLEAGLYVAGAATIIYRIKGASGQIKKFLFAEGNGSSDNPVYGPGTSTDSVSSAHLRYLIQNFDTSAAINASSAGTIFDNGWHTVAITDSGTALTLYVDGTQIETKAYTRSVAAQGYDRAGLGCLFRGSAASFFAGRIGRVIAIGRVLTATERANAITWVTGS